MYVTPSNIIIPGVSDNQSFVKWIDSHKIQLSTELSIGESSLGGIGLYYEKSHEEHLEDLEILRIPSSSKIDYMSLLKLLDELKTRDGSFDEEIKESQFIVQVLTAMEPSTETQILHSYIVAFYLLKQLRQSLKELAYFSESPLIEYDQYLDILCGTYTLGIFREAEDPFVSRLSKGIQKSQNLYEVLMELLNETYDEYRFEDWLTFEVFYQLQQAIQSRTLEIPHQENSTETQKNGDNEEKDQDAHTEIDGNFHNLSLEDTSKVASSDEQTDFHVNVTLVPILDFANHIHNNNAYFDVDKKCDDIILKLKHDILKDKKSGDKFEVTISYSPVESIQHFINTYGFIPSIVDDTHYQLFELKLPIEEMVSHGHLISKWLGIVPQIQLIRGARKSYINLFNNNLPLVFAGRLTYNPQWNEDLESHFKLFNELPDDYEVDINEVQELVRLQEEGPYDIISGVGPIGLRYNGKVLQDVEELTSSLGDGTNGTVSFDDLVKRCVEQIIHHCRDFLAKGSSHDSLERSHPTLSEYSQYQREIMQNLVDCYDATEDYNDIVLPESLSQTEWEVSFRSLPRQMDIY